MAGLVVFSLCISSLYSLVYTNQFLNVERRRALPKNIPHPFPDIFVDEQEEDVVLEPFVSRPELERRSRVGTDLSNLKLAAFNVRIFGKRKMGTPGISKILVQIILRYDVILIQEVRDSSGTAIMNLLFLVNRASQRGQYDITISPRLGRTSSKEQYAFFYRKDVLSVKNTYVYDDGQESLKSDTFEREPYIVHFSSTFTNITDFVLVAIHTSPSEAPQEIDELVNVYDDVTRKLQIPDVVILGDLNAGCSYMSDSDWKKNRLANDKRFHWLISDGVDTTVAGGHCAYDRFVVAGDAMLDAMIKSSAGSFEFDQVLGLNKTKALEVSDHYPVEIQVYSKRMVTAVRHVAKTVVYAFRMKQPADVSKRKLYGLRRIFSGFTVTTTYTRSKAISRITFSKTVQSKEEAVNAILSIKDKALRDNAVSLDQIQLAEFQIKGAWNKETKLSGSGSGVIKFVCETYPSPNCWIAIVLNQ